ncbi:MAG: exopolysaccharide biosynthesis protein [Candidatus Devosia phytovorans]|uniref:Exopolysaccharide biosynthesis protein n=1 Tax=Candidatus Devosia phytovorans TaxID=3121372 RepID=A0AAJ5VUR6_9HYPH|nr:exopolysaccharide biosynthesis protein [Devosia sp.]WEK04501.1 MAG: exopolysaccharide biosynthesis protein [Devosia sp.]
MSEPSRSPLEGQELPPHDHRLSATLLRIAARPGRDRIYIRDLLAELDHRAIAAMLFIFAVPNTIPVPPGVSGVLGAPLLFLATQLMLGMRPWLPRIIADRSFARADFEKVVTKVGPWLQKAEKLMRPRFEFLARPPVEYLVGAMVLLLSIVLFLPIPLGNMLPAIAICIYALGLIERDGLWILIGTVTSLVSLVIVSGVIAAFVYAGWLALTTFFNF